MIIVFIWGNIAPLPRPSWRTHNLSLGLSSYNSSWSKCCSRLSNPCSPSVCTHIPGWRSSSHNICIGTRPHTPPQSQCAWPWSEEGVWLKTTKSYQIPNEEGTFWASNNKHLRVRQTWKMVTNPTSMKDILISKNIFQLSERGCYSNWSCYQMYLGPFYVLLSN